jgi:hypothetical protein
MVLTSTEVERIDQWAANAHQQAGAFPVAQPLWQQGLL